MWRTVLAPVLLMLAPAAASSQTRSRADTLPNAVVDRVIKAFNKQDLNALTAEYDSVYIHDRISNTKGPHPVVRTEMRDSLALAFQQAPHDMNVKVVERFTVGPLVVVKYQVTTRGRTSEHLDIAEIRHGKVVREWEY